MCACVTIKAPDDLELQLTIKNMCFFRIDLHVQRENFPLCVEILLTLVLMRVVSLYFCDFLKDICKQYNIKIPFNILKH